MAEIQGLMADSGEGRPPSLLKLRSECQAMHAKLEAQRTIISRFRASAAKWTAEAEVLKAKTSLERTRITDLDSKLQEDAAALEAARKRSDQLARVTLKVCREIEEANLSLGQEALEAESLAASVRAPPTKRMEALHKALALERSKKAQLQEEIEKEKLQRGQLRDALKVHLERKEAERGDLEQKKAQLPTRLEALEAEIKAVQLETEMLRSQAKEAESGIQELESVIIPSYERERQELIQRVRAVAEEDQQLRTQLQAEQERLWFHQNRVASQTGELRALQTGGPLRVS